MTDPTPRTAATARDALGDVPAHEVALMRCPEGCGHWKRATLPPKWEQDVEAGYAIPIVGCGNPWHYVHHASALAAAEAPGRVVALVQCAEADQRRAFEWLSGDICVYLSGGGTCYRGPEDPCHKNVEARSSMRSHRYVTALDMDAASIVKRVRAIIAAPAPTPSEPVGRVETVRARHANPADALTCEKCLAPEDSAHLSCALWGNSDLCRFCQHPATPSEPVERCPDADTIGCGHVHGDAVKP